MDDFRGAAPRGWPGPDRRGRPEDWVIGLLRRVTLRTWLLLGAALAILLALALWALVALWQAIGEQAPGWQEQVGGLISGVAAGEAAPIANPGSAGAAMVSGVVAQAKNQVGQYAQELDRVVPGASEQLKSAARGWLGEGAVPGSGEAESRPSAVPHEAVSGGAEMPESP
ncbi:MAG: hypothetical protein ACLGHG_00295 [Gammaproteobacteria bacterium]